MEKEYGHHFIRTVLKVELVGTCLLMLASNLVKDGDASILVVPLAYFALVTCFYEISGAHLNPAVSIGVWLSEQRYVSNLLYLIFVSTA